MKEIKAYIKKHKMDNVVLALSKIEGLTGVSVVEVKGFGRGRGGNRKEASSMTVFDDRLFDVPRIKLEIFCHDHLVDEIVATIVEHAHTGLRGDGKIYVTEVMDAVRISTKERGAEAV